jgi:Zn-dependent peptidase ImmA (M78 family)
MMWLMHLKLFARIQAEISMSESMSSDSSKQLLKIPEYSKSYLDSECENIITKFLNEIYRKVEFPIRTDDLTKLIETEADDLDLYADLSHEGEEVLGATYFQNNKKPEVKISARLSEDWRVENRLRTTLTHEFGHVHFHADYFAKKILLISKEKESIICKRDNIIQASTNLWMEHQAGYVCGAILMPKNYICSIVDLYRNRHPSIQAIHKDDAHGRRLIAEVMSQFKVSEDAAIVRLSQLKVFGNRQSGKASKSQEF